MSYENGFLLISQIGRKNVCISTRLLLRAILGVNLSKFFRGPPGPGALAQAASCPELVMAAATGRARFAHRWPSAWCATYTFLANDSLRLSVTAPKNSLLDSPLATTDRQFFNLPQTF